MKLRITTDQIHKVIQLARKFKDSSPSCWISLEDIIVNNPNPNLKALCDYLESLGYNAVLEVEALMDYGGELLLYGEDERESFETCYNYIHSVYGGKKGNIDMAIDYMIGKPNFADRLEAAISAIEEHNNT